MSKIAQLALLPVTTSLAELPADTTDASVQCILQKRLAAVGGLENWSEIESLHLSGSVEQNGHEFDIFVVKKAPSLSSFAQRSQH